MAAEFQVFLPNITVVRVSLQLRIREAHIQASALTENLRIFPRYFQKASDLLHQLTQQPLLSASIPIHFHLPP
jgi:hypothetical protein